MCNFRKNLLRNLQRVREIEEYSGCPNLRKSEGGKYIFGPEEEEARDVQKNFVVRSLKIFIHKSLS